MRGQKFAYKKMQKFVDAEFTTTKQTERPKKFCSAIVTSHFKIPNILNL